jgi:hypothetical protein
MILKMFAIRDGKTESYGTPFFAPHKGQAVRMFQQLANDRRSEVWKFPRDYVLFEVGSFDLSSGEVAHLTVPAMLGMAAEYLDERLQGEMPMVQGSDVNE